MERYQAIVCCMGILFSLVTAPIAARVLPVGKDEIYTSIHQAIEAALPGDTVHVSTGIYREKNISITKPLVLQGIGYPQLDGENLYEIISIKSSHVTIDGFVLLNSGISAIEDYAGIKVYAQSNITIVNNILHNVFFGISLASSKNCLIKNNLLKGEQLEEQQSGNGIHCWKCDSIQIIGNCISGHRDGIYFEFVTHSIIWRNQSSQNLRYGLHFMFSNNDAYISNVFNENGAGVAVMFSNHVKMFSNYFSDNWGDASYGILLKEISDSDIEGNIFIRNTSAIYMEGVSRLQLSKNRFIDNGWAMKIQASCMDINVSSNQFAKNSFDVSTNGSLVLNNFNNNYWDKYEGYDLNHDGKGDVPYRPVSLFSMLVEQNPSVMMLFRSMMVSFMDKTEKILPSITPGQLEDLTPTMKPFLL